MPRDFNSNKETIFRVEKGWGSGDTAFNLEKDGLIWGSSFFRVYVFFLGMTGKLQAGSYFLSPSMNIHQIAKKISSGDIAKTMITIPEGFTAEKIYQKLKNITDADLPELKNNEGYLFPDTYEIPYGMEQSQIIKIMRDNLDKKTADLKITPEIIIMASILEREVQTKEDGEIVSGIFWKRLKSGIPLESCATIAYIKGVDQWRYSYEDTRIESPYNTYLHFGLPPGSISNPGLKSIEAASHPKESPYWYYLSTPEGKTIFSRTLEEHNIAKVKYLK